MDSKHQTSMAPAWRRLLTRHKGKTLVELCRRPKIQERIAGFVVDFSDTLILLHRLDWDTFSLNGYTILRDADVKQHRLFSRPNYWQSKAAREQNLRPRPVLIDLSNWKAAAEDIASRYPLLTVHQEVRFPDECWIGVPTEISSKCFVLQTLDINAEWNGTYRLKTADLSRMDFDCGYENALAYGTPRPRVPRQSGLVKTLRGLRGLNLRRPGEPICRKRGC